MCGRFSLGTTNLKAEYNLVEEVQIHPSFNVSPGVQVPVVISENGRNKIVFMKWGFELKFGDGPAKQLINAMGETLSEKPTFKKLIQSQRCLIPATGFYEWMKTENGKIPHYIYLKEQKLFSLGGLWRLEKTEDGQLIQTCVIITTEPNELMKPIHNRMPLIVGKLDEGVWLNSHDEKIVSSLVKSYPSEAMQAITVSRKVNNVGNDSPDLIEEFKWELGK